jgi:hypothetical protein
MYINSRESISDAQNTALFSSSFSLKKKLFDFALLYCFTDLNHLTVCLDFRNAPNLFINYWVNYFNILSLNLVGKKIEILSEICAHCLLCLSKFSSPVA